MPHFLPQQEAGLMELHQEAAFCTSRSGFCIFDDVEADSEYVRILDGQALLQDRDLSKREGDR
jgi:hypothetical protein